MRNLLYAIPRPGCIFRHAEKVAKCTGINSSRLKFSPYGEKRKLHELNGPKGPGPVPAQVENHQTPGTRVRKLTTRTNSFLGSSAREMVSPSGVAGVALRGLDDLAACPRPRCPFWLPRATCPERLAPKNITLVEPPGTCLRFLKTGRRHHLET